ncbi:MAG: 3-deoxy-8-phosphooctulonate synthase [Phycisphaerae bacterium]|nr:3-deoxy-8-phosphooctulonate synthase [Phycisphaerae bacterium]
MTQQHVCNIGSVTIGAGQLAVIAGPCVAESLQLCLEVAGSLADSCRRLGIGYVFKASYDKANRSSLDSYRGPGQAKGLDWLRRVRRETGAPVLTDVHEVAQVAAATEAVDCIQIPALLCRQTDLLLAAGKTLLPVNIKKGQFMAPWDMANAVEKVRSTGNQQVLLTERGTSFGYNMLVTDFRGIVQMQEFAPVVFDATHSVQEPGGLGHASGGRGEYAPLLARAALAAGADALFVETHVEPDKAKSDAASQMSLKDMPSVLKSCLRVFEAARAGPNA